MTWVTTYKGKVYSCQEDDIYFDHAFLNKYICKSTDKRRLKCKECFYAAGDNMSKIKDLLKWRAWRYNLELERRKQNKKRL